jgi:L-2-hydroxyglutarate oxidase LhgO
VEKVEITIIGAGVIGLAVAARLAPRFSHDLLVVERHESFGRETSSRNSEVIHAGIYYPPGSLKARLCVQGQRQLYELCHKHDIPCQQLGKLIVAVTTAEEKQLELNLATGRENGVENLKLITARDCRQLEPAVKARAALFSPSTGIIDSHNLMRFYHQQAKSLGATFAFNTEIKSIESTAGGYILETTSDSFSFSTEIIINCAGLEATVLSQKTGIPTPLVHYAKGCYFSYTGKSPVKHLVYPVPPAGGHGLGIHATLDLGGRVRFGPDLEYLKKPDYQVDSSRKNLFCQAIKRYLPNLDEKRLEPEMAGIRPRLQGPGDEFMDFIIQEEREAGFPGFINLLGIESPGLTTAPAIADKVAALLGVGIDSV